ncbi:MAG: DUF1957 domain-containing protein [Treponemataceae bacterium]|nr:DUF1957 domain-containing protein [Treponemataceae bacterium]
MSKKSLVMTIVAQEPFIRHVDQADENYSKNEILFTAISQTYLPLLNMFADLEAEGIAFKVNMVISPVVCEMLSDPQIQLQYIEWQTKIVCLGEAEVERCKNDPDKLALAQLYLARAKRNLRDFQETLNQDILSKFIYFARRGNIEFLATSATPAFFPHYMDIPEAIQAQVETGLQFHKKYFGVAPEGFWLPNMGYAPALEWIIRPYGFNYTVLDTHGLLFGTPQPRNGIFSPARTRNSLVLFARDKENGLECANTSVYRNQEADIGFECDDDYFKTNFGATNVRVGTGYRYSCKEDGKVYSQEDALTQAVTDAENFVQNKVQKLEKAAMLCETDVCDVCTYNIEDFGTNWYEGITFLEQVMRKVAFNEDIELALYSELIGQQFNLEKVEPFPSSSEGTGYGENLLDNANSWMLRYVRKACERMIDLAARFTDDTGLKERSLNLAAKEVLLAMSADWPRMVLGGDHPDYAEFRFKESVAAFSTVYESLGSNAISTEWLTRMEKQHNIFPEMNYHVFATKQ